MMMAVLWYSPAARRSNNDATITTPSSLASAPRSSLDGPGISSANWKYLWSSSWQKYCEA